MTGSPLLPPSQAGHRPEPEATGAELDQLTELAFAAIGTEPVISLVGAHNLPGLAGATADGGTWQISDGACQVTRHPRLPPGTG